jgi:hypothetical protein
MQLIAALLLLTTLGGTPMHGPQARANTDWFRDARYGVFVHYLNGLQNNAESPNSLGRETSWDECVREFDVEKFADQMKQCGAGYVIFTVMQVTRHMIAPNATYDRLTGYKPGEACSTRDLIEDLYQALSKRNIPLMLYYTGDGPRADPQAAAGMKCPPDGQVTVEFVRNWASVVREYGERYKEKVVGYWTDGCYPFIGYDDEKLGILAEGLRAGNPKRIIALNNGVLPKVTAYTRHEDFTTGEMNTFTDVPKSRFIEGEQWHLLSFLGNWWGGPGLQITRRNLIDYIHTVNRVGGVVSIDVMLYRDGLIDRAHLHTLTGLREALLQKDRDAVAWKTGGAVPPGNRAWRQLASLLSLDGQRTLVPSVGEIHAARMGVDGDPNTCAVGAHEWPWSYHVDMGEVAPLKRLVVRFGPGYPTVGDILVSEDGETWKKVHEWTDGTGKPIEVKLDEPRVRFVRVRSIKPDGPNQPGIQMSVAELEAYAE